MKCPNRVTFMILDFIPLLTPISVFGGRGVMSKIPLGYPDNVWRSAVEKSEPFKSNGGGDFKSSGGCGGVLDCLYKIY